MSEPAAFVHIELNGVTRPVGRLYVKSTRGRQAVASFLYDDDWIRAPDRFALEPALTVSAAPHYTLPERGLFGALSDSAPDRWGQTLMRREERALAVAEARAPRTLQEIDFLLGVSDAQRQGALRFAESEDGPFVAPDRHGGVPPLVELSHLLSATDRLLADAESPDDLRLLLAPGSSLGGARPKASVRDLNGDLLIAKFPKEDDEYRIVTWESVALQLAALAGIQVAAHRLERVAGRDVLLVRRFDRTRVGSVLHRIPYLSAMSLLNASDGESRSYPELADAIRRHGAASQEDLHELWRRMVYTVMISNVDDHLRNHGFLYAGNAGWRLSPVFDLNPVPRDVRAPLLSTALAADGDRTASLDLALESAPAFGLSVKRANEVVREVSRAVQQWRDVARTHGVSAREVDRLASAFVVPS